MKKYALLKLPLMLCVLSICSTPYIAAAQELPGAETGCEESLVYEEDSLEEDFSDDVFLFEEDGEPVYAEEEYLDQDANASLTEVDSLIEETGTLDSVAGFEDETDSAVDDNVIDKGLQGTGDGYWRLTGSEEAMTLTIGGCEEMSNFTSYNTIPWKKYTGSITKIVVEPGVKYIGKYAFGKCYYVTDVELPDGLETIGYAAFSECSLLKSISIPETVTEFGDHAFKDCTNLETINFPEKLEKIGIYAFQNCTSLTQVSLPDSITWIGNNVFSGCYKLTTAKLPASITNIPAHLFFGCSKLESITLPDSITSINECAFSGCSSLTGIDIPDSVTSIGNSAFSSCSKFKSIVIPDSVKTIGSRTFQNCNNLTSVTLSKSLGYLATGIFRNCSSLPEIELPAKLVNIYDEAFEGCSSLQNVAFPDTLAYIGDHAFSGCGRFTEIILPDNVTKIGENAFVCSNVTHISLSAKLRTLGSSAISCSNLQRLENKSSYGIVGSIQKIMTVKDEAAYLYRYPQCGHWINEADGNVIPMDTEKYYTIPAQTTVIWGPNHTVVIDEAVAHTCTETGLTEGSHCSVCGKILSERELVPALGHDWEAPAYTWSESCYFVTAKRICKHDSSHQETDYAYVASKVTKSPSVKAMGQTTYIATFGNSSFATQKRVIENIPKLNPMTVKAKTVSLKASKLKKNQKLAANKVFVVKKAVGKVTYTLRTADKKAKKKITVSSDGKLTVKKGLKKGTYKIKVDVTAAGNSQCSRSTRTVTVTVKIK